MQILSNHCRFTYEVRFYGLLSTPATGPDYRGEQAIAGISRNHHPKGPELLRAAKLTRPELVPARTEGWTRRR